MTNIIESYVTDLSIRIIDGLIKKGYTWLTGEIQPYRTELSKIINNSVNIFQQGNFSQPSDKVLFFQSEVFVEELIKYQFGLPINMEELKTAIENDQRIQIPTDSEMEYFVNIFMEQINLSPQLERLHIDHNYKKTTFRIATQLDNIRQKLDELIIQTKNTVQTLEIAQALAAEWEKELDAIKQLLYQFKPYTALELINKLQERITNHQIKNELFESQILFLKANAISDKNGFGIKEDAAHIYIQAYKLNPNSKDYLRHAALGYLALEEPEKAKSIADQLILQDEFDLTAWVVRMHLSDNKEKVLNEVPIALLKRKEFKLNAFFILYQDMEAARVVHQPDSLINIEVVTAEPFQINYTNFKFWLLFSEYLFSKIYYEYPMLTNYAVSDELKAASLYQYYRKVLSTLLESVKSNEINDELAYVRFKLHYVNLIIDGDFAEIHHLAKAFEEIKNKNHVHVLQMVQAYNLLEKKEYQLKSIEIIDQFGSEEHEILALFKAMLLLSIGKQNEAIKGYEKYMLGLDAISIIQLNNLLQFFKLGYGQKSTEAIAFLAELMEKDVFPNQAMKLLLKLFVESLHKPDFVDGIQNDNLLKEIEKNLDPKYPEIREFYLSVLSSIKKYERLINYLRPQIKFKSDVKDVILFCEALYYSSGNKLELLQVLRKARQTLPPVNSLLRMEIDLRQKQHDWAKVIELSEIAIVCFPGQPQFIKSFFGACVQALAIDKIKQKKDIINDVKFDEQGTLIIYTSFVQAGLFTEAIEILYQSAKTKYHIQSRQAYMSSLVRFPEGTFQQYDVVVRDCYVVYNINGAIETTYIGSTGSDDPIQQIFIGKKVNERFTFHDEFMYQTTSGQILKITNKYGALLDEIMHQAANPLSGLKFRQFKFDGTTADEMRDSLKKELGALGSMNQQRTEQCLQQYQNAEITFSEIVKSNFRNNPVDGYYILTGPNSNFFQTAPSNIPHIPIEEKTRIILDFTTIVLFYELEKEFRRKYPHRFLVSNYVKHKLSHLLDETVNEPTDKLSVTITMETVIPHFYANDFQEKRIAHFQGLIDWVNLNCDFDSVDEKLDLLFQDNGQTTTDDDYIHYLVDNKIMSERENHLLLSSDLFFFKTFQNMQRRMTGPENYLNKYFQEMSTSAYLISKNYVGIQVSKDDLIREFSLFISGSPNHYMCAIENLKANRSNGNIRNIAEGVLFMKWLYLQSIINTDLRYRSAEYLLVNLLQGLNERGIGFLLSMFTKHFYLLPDAQNEIFSILSRLTEKAN
ncbi:MAG TPA: hypothetical protein VIJ57_05290 [Hanamia sp.]